MIRLVLTLSAALMMSLLAGCAQTRLIVVRPGEPVQIMQEATLKVRKVGDDGVGTLRVDGWYAVEPAVWEALMRRLESR